MRQHQRARLNLELLFDLLDLAQYFLRKQRRPAISPRSFQPAGHVEQYAQRVSKSASDTRRQQRVLGKFQQAAAQHQDVPDKIAAVDR